MFFLFDCDNFFVSCERVFAPGLKKRPVVVLSNNDGCVVSRSYEAKALGIPMGAPYFKIERFFTARGGVALSSNYELYADMSARVMSVLRSCFSNLEVYSIDEAFARLPDSQTLSNWPPQSAPGFSVKPASLFPPALPRPKPSAKSPPIAPNKKPPTKHSPLKTRNKSANICNNWTLLISGASAGI